MPRAEDEAVAVQPFRVGGIMRKRVTIKHRTNFRTTERQAQMAGVAGVDGVHGEAAGFVGGAGKSGCIEIHGRDFLRVKKSAQSRSTREGVKNTAFATTFRCINSTSL